MKPNKYERDLSLIHDRFHGNNEIGMTLRELAEKYQISHQRVSQILFEHGVTNSREEIIRRVSNKLYEYICEYKSTHDGSTPNLWRMTNDSKIYIVGKVRRSLNYLEQMGKIKITRGKYSGKDYRYKDQLSGVIEVEVIGARWIPPKNKE